MKTIIFKIALLLLTVSAYGQSQLFKKYDFDKGGYYILGVLSESDRSSLQDSIGEFYTDDIAVLNKFKKDWVFKKEGKRYACGYHYTVFVCKQGEILDEFSINLNCEEIVTDKGYFYFNPNLLRQFYGKLKKPYSQRHKFNTIAEAREYRASILKDTTLIMTPKTLWTEYEGWFHFTYKCKEGTPDCFDEEEKILMSVKVEIAKKYPNEKFKLSVIMASSTEIGIRVSCNKSLSDKFDLYYRDKNSTFGKWEPADLRLETYWKTRK